MTALQKPNLTNYRIFRHRQNKVFDDDNDYFKFNRKKDGKEKGKKMVIALDFATRRVIESTQEDQKIRQRLLADSVEHLKKVEDMYKHIQELSQAVTTHKLNDVKNLFYNPKIMS